METTPPTATSADPSVPAVTSAEPSVPSVPAVAGPSTVAGYEPPPPAPRGQPVNVAFLPLALAVFVIIAFVLAAWTFLAAG